MFRDSPSSELEAFQFRGCSRHRHHFLGDLRGCSPLRLHLFLGSHLLFVAVLFKRERNPRVLDPVVVRDLHLAWPQPRAGVLRLPLVHHAHAD